MYALTLDEESRLRNAAMRDGQRSYAIVLLLLGTGLRVGELHRLLRPDLMLADACRLAILIPERAAKGGHKRIVEIPSDARAAVSAYWRDEIFRSGPVRPNDSAFRGTDGASRPSIRSFQRLLSKLGSKAGLAKLSPHMLRHTCATRLVQTSTVPIAARQLGHRSIRTTQAYVGVSRDEIRDAVERAARLTHARQLRLDGN